MNSQKSEVALTIASLEADLRRVKRDAEAFGKDLKVLREQKEKLEREKQEEISKAERATNQILKEELQQQKLKTEDGEQTWTSQVCAA